AHEVFKRGGLIKKYLNHVEVGFRSERELEYLRLQKEHPWQYSFCEILSNPHPDFYKMRDLFTGKTFMVYSQGMSTTLSQNPGDIRAWFLLTSYDGMCIQTFGTIACF